MAVDDLSFCSSCLICAKLCIHPKVRLKLNDCHLPSSPKKTVGSVNNKQILSFTKCVSKFCELFNSPPDDGFARDFSDFFSFTTLSGKCPVCEDCQNRIRLISKVMIQIETLQAQLMTLKKLVENDLTVTKLPSPHRSDDYTRNNVNKRFTVDIDTKARVFREQLRRKLQSPLIATNHVEINYEADAMKSNVIDEITSLGSNTYPGYPNLFNDADVETFENANGLSMYCDNEYFDVKPDPDHGEVLSDSIDDSTTICGEQLVREKVPQLNVDVENEARDKSNTHIYASVEIKGPDNCILTLSNLEEPVDIDNSLRGDELDEMHNSYFSENIAYGCNLCPFATKSIQHLNLHSERHAGNKDATSETLNSIQDIDCFHQLQQPSSHHNEENTSEIEFNFDAAHQSSDSADINLIARIANPETKDVAHTFILNQLEEPNNSDDDSLKFQTAKSTGISDSETNRTLTPQAKPDWNSSLGATKLDSSIKNGRPPGVKQRKTRKKCTRDKSNLLKCPHVNPVKGQCGRKFYDQDSLDAHINRLHKNIPASKAFECNLCPFAVSTIELLTLHRKRHAGIKDATCEFCGMSFLGEKHLLVHKRSKHDEPYPFHCNICEKGFNNNHDLKLHHYRNHEGGEYTHRCSVCNEGFYSKVHLTIHMVKHTERTFKCNECPKAFQKKHNLQRHVKTHTGIRPYACDLCNWKFYTQHKLDLHRSVHTKERPFLCQECGFSCRLKDLLTAHLKVHENNHSIAEKGIKKQPRLAKPRNRRIKIYENNVPPSHLTATQISAEISLDTGDY